MKYLLDTDTYIYWLNGRDSVRNRLLAVGWVEVGIRLYGEWAEDGKGCISLSH
ncbi:MAG: hypothetical protein AB4352_05095 [Hormoscilla sp.]